MTHKNRCSVPGCNHQADGTCLFSGNVVCRTCEKKHWQDPTGKYIWNKLGIDITAKEKQLKLE